jgi:parallel beta-helix repeat protein
VEGASVGVTCQSGAVKCDMLHTELRLNGLNASIASVATFKYSTSRNSGGDGIQALAGADLWVADSQLTDAGGDHVRMTGAGKLKVEYSILKTQHCALHIDASTGLTVRNNVFDNNSYGLMLGGAPAGSIIGHNNFMTSLSTWLEETNTNGAVDATGNYWGNTTAQLRTPTTVTTGTTGATTTFTDVGPRPEPN